MHFLIKKRNLLLIWLTAIIFINLTFVMLLCIKSNTAAIAFCILAVLSSILAIIGTIARSKEIKKIQLENAKIAREKAGRIDEILNKKQ